VIELLAITDDPTPIAPPLRIVPAAGLGLVVSAAAEDGDAVDAESLWRREELIEELMQERTLLPVRYGTLLEDDSAAAEAIAGRAEGLTAALRRVRGAVELSVRVVARSGDGDARTAGAMHERLAAVAREHARHAGPELLRAAYLVDRAQIDDFVALVRALQNEHPEFSALCTGPWPPYSFSEEDAA
jgi:hypothetical protein